MALIKCPECGEKVSDKADVCIYCGYPLKEVALEDDVILKDGKFHFLLSESNQKDNAVDIDDAVDLTVKMIKLLQEENKRKRLRKDES